MSRGDPASFILYFCLFTFSLYLSLFPSQRRGACGWAAMMSRLFISIGELDQVAIVIRSPNKANARRKVVASEFRRNDDGRNINQKGVQMRDPLLIDERRIDAVFDQRRLVLNGFVHDRVELMIGHDFEKYGHQLILRSKTLVMFRGIGIPLEAILRAFDDFGEVGRGDDFCWRLERRMGAT